MNQLAAFWRSLSGRYTGHGKLFLFLLILCGFSGSALAQSSTVYVDDGFAGSSVNDPVSFVGNPEATCAANAGAVYGVDAFATITDALANVQSGGTVCVAAGTYAETDGAGRNLVINKPVSIYGAQAGVDARNRSDVGASIIIPAVGVTGLGYGDSTGRIATISSDGVLLDGFVFDGDNTTITTGTATMGAADPDVAAGIFATGSNIHFINNEVRNLVFVGFYGENDDIATPAREGNVIAHNWIHNLDAPSLWGVGILSSQNYYGNIHDNLVDDVRIGIQTHYETRPVADPANNAVIRNNTFRASATGIYHNYRDADSGLGDPSPYTIDGNQVSALNNPLAANRPWSGITIQAFYDGNAIITNNTVNGTALANTGRLRLGYTGSNLISGPVVLDGGSVTDVDYGVLATDGAFYRGAVQNLIVRGIAFSDVSLAALYVEDTAIAGTETVDNSARITVGAGNDFGNSLHHGALSGPLASIEFEIGVALLDKMLVHGEGQGHRGASPDENGNVRQVMPGIVNAAIADAAVGGTVTLDVGTFAQNVIANKSVSLVGPKFGIAGHDVSRDGTGEAILSPATGRAIVISSSGVVVDGLQLGPITADRVVSIQNTAGLTGIRLVNNRIVDFTSTTSSSAAIFVSANTGPATVGMDISHNLFQELLNGTYGNYAMGVKVTRAQDLLIEDNEFRRVQSNAVQLNWVTDAQMRGNRIDGVTRGFTNVGVQVSFGSGIHISDNSFGGTAQAFLFNRNSGDDVSFTCNHVHNSSTGVRGAIFGTTGPAVAPRVFHNSIQASRAFSNEFGEQLAFGSNWYGGSASPGNTSVLLIADALVADPTNGGAFDVAACGDNTPTQIVAYAGNGQTTPINTAFGQPLVARVQDALGGAVITPQTVTFSAPSSGASASLSTLSGSTDYNGTVSTNATANGTAGDYAVSAASGSFGASAGFALTNGKMAGTLSFNPLTAPYGTLHTVTATMSPADTNVTCTAVSGVPAQSAAPGDYLVSASCEGDNTVATGTATYVVTASTAGIQPVGSAPVGVVTVDPQPDADAKKTYFSWVTNGSAAEFVRAEFIIGSGNAAPHAGDLALEYWDTSDNTWKLLPVSFDAGTGTWSGVFGPSTGFPLTAGAQSQFRATFQRGGRYITTANLVGASSGLTLATSAPVATEVADIDLVGSGNAAGVVGVAVDTGYSLVNSGAAALSGGGMGNPIPAQQAPNDENVRGRFFIEWDSGALTPADPNGVGGNGSNCGAATCASPDVAVEFFDVTSSSYRPIYNLRAELDGSNQPTGRLYGHFGAATSGGVPVPAGYSGTYLFRTTSKTHTGNYTVISQVVGVDTGTVYAQAADQTIAVGSGNAASISIVGDDFDASIVGGIAYTINGDGNFRVLVRDSGGNPVDGASVAFNAPASGASAVLSAGSCTTDIAGECHVTGVTNDVAGSFVVEASIANGQFVEFDLTNFADVDPSQVQIATVSGDGQTAQVGNAYGLPLVAKVTDRFGNPLEAVAVEFSAPATGASVTPTSVNATTDADGLVDSGALTANATAGGFSVSASVDPLECTSASCNVGYALTNTAAGAANVTLVSSAASAAVGTVGAYTLTATVSDDDNNPVPGVSVTLIGPSAGAGVMPAVHAGISDSAGQVVHVFDANTIAGAFQVQAVVSGVNSTDVTLTNLAGAAAKIVYVAGDGQSAAVGAAFATDLTVRVVDQYDNAVDDAAAASVSFTAPGTGASATVTPSATSGANGLASTPATANSEAGNYTVVASFNGHDVGFALTNTVGALSITDIVWADNGTTSIAFDGTAKSATATVTGSSLTPSFTYNGSATAPTNAGSYQVIATIDDGNVYGTATAMLTIDPAQVTLSFGGLAHVYDGTIKAATVTTAPVGVSGVSLAYAQSGSPVTPVNAGSYDVTATLSNPNYVLTGSTTATLLISQATPQIMLSDLVHLFDGTPKAATVTTVPASLASALVVTYDGSTTPPSAIGSYAVVAALSGDPNYADTQTSGTLIIGDPVSSVTVSKTVDRTTVHTGLTLTWTIVVENAGPSSADVELLDILPNSVDNPHWTCVHVGGAICGMSSGTADIDFTSAIPAGGTVVVVVSATVPSTTAVGTDIENIAVIAWQSDGAAEVATDSASTEVVPVGIFSDGFEDTPPGKNMAMPDDTNPAALRGWALGADTTAKPVLAVEFLDHAGKSVVWLDSLTIGQQRLLRLRYLDADGMQRADSWQSWPMDAAMGYAWDQTIDGLTLRFMPIGTQLRKSGAMVQLRVPAGSAIPMRAITHSATAY